MAEFTLHDTTTAPAEARERLEKAQKAMGFIPNLFANMAEAPASLEAYQTLDGIFAKTSLSPVEREVVLLATSVENRCHFCVAAHSGRAKQAGMDAAVLDALRAGGKLPDTRLDALATFTRTVVRERGWAGDAAVQAFVDAGFTQGQVLEVVLGVSLKTLSNYTNHIAGTELDSAFAHRSWKAPA